jgi:hypothetical protein
VGRPQEPQPQNDTEAQAPATEAPAAPAAPAEPAVDLKLGFPGEAGRLREALHLIIVAP